MRVVLFTRTKAGGGGQTFGPNDVMWMGLGYQFSLIGSRPI